MSITNPGKNPHGIYINHQLKHILLDINHLKYISLIKKLVWERETIDGNFEYFCITITNPHKINKRLKLKDVFYRLKKKLTLAMVFYTLITNTITLGHFTLTNFKWQISQNSRNIENHWNFNLNQIILTRRVGRIFTFSCYKIKCQIIKLRSLTFCNSQLKRSKC